MQRNEEFHNPTNYADEQLELLGLFQEECAEVIQELSKMRRSGPNFIRHNSELTNEEHLKREIMDMLLMLDVCALLKIINVDDKTALDEYREYKIEKLRKWSKLGSVLDEL
jgi:NTP pyrophosphatase (non-canonical NTP hydrolase)